MLEVARGVAGMLFRMARCATGIKLEHNDAGAVGIERGAIFTAGGRRLDRMQAAVEPQLDGSAWRPIARLRCCLDVNCNVTARAACIGDQLANRCPAVGGGFHQPDEHAELLSERDRGRIVGPTTQVVPKSAGALLLLEVAAQWRW